jgi:DNA-binding NtrC family response regulator
VIEAESGRAALETWEVRREEIDLVLTDMVMPNGINGRDLIRELQGRQPDIKHIYASGYNPFQDGSNHDLIEGVNFLQKPYQTQKLAHIVRKTLDRRAQVVAV